MAFMDDVKHFSILSYLHLSCQEPGLGSKIRLGLWWGMSYGHKEPEFFGQVFLWIKFIWKVNSPDSAVGMNLYTESLYIVGTVSSLCEIRQVKLNLIPAIIQPHGHGTYEGLDSGCGLKED